MARLGLAVSGLGFASALVSTHLLAAPAPAPAATPAAKPAAIIEQGRKLFNDTGCNNCHMLGDAGATGQIGPAFDKSGNLDEAFLIDRMTNGQGAMPGFGGALSEQEIAIVAKYIALTAAR